MEQQLDVSLSIDGKQNAYYHYCSHVGHHKAFAVCCNLIEKRKSGRLSELYSECSATIGKKTCPAIAMRKEELAAGKSIYFVSRAELVERSAIRDSNIVARAANFVQKIAKGAKSVVTSSPIPEPVKKKEEAIMTMDYSKVVSSMATDAVKKETLKPNAGESMIDFAKRMMAAKKETA